MNGEEISRRFMVGEDCHEIDFKKFNNYIGKFKRRKVERREELFKNMKTSVESNKTVAYRLRMKLIERGRTPNLNANFYEHT